MKAGEIGQSREVGYGGVSDDKGCYCDSRREERN